MSPAIDELFSIRRVLVALDPARSSAALLETAVEFARRVEAEIEGLFIEDIDLMRLAELPFAHALSLPSGLPQPLETAAVEREMRALAGAARRSLEIQARKMNVSCSFRVVRGRLESELRAAGTADLVILERGGAAVTRYVFLRQAARFSAIGAVRSLLLLRGYRMVAASVAVAYDGSKACERALAAAASLGRRLRAAGAAEAGPVVLCLGKTRAAAKRAEEHARESASRAKIAASFRTLSGSADELAAALAPEPDTLLVLPAELPLLASDAGERLLSESAGPILLVR